MFFNSWGGDMAVDLGTANTLVSVRGRGIVLIEPSVVAVEKDSKRVLAVGIDAKRMLGRTPGSIVAIRPLKDGVIADFEVTEAMLRYFINKTRVKRFPWQPKPRVVVCVPSGVTEVEKRAVFEATISAGARQAFLIEEPMAAAIGAGLPIQEPTGSMVVDIGGGTTEVAVISLGGIVVAQSIRIAGDEFDDAIIAHVKRVYNVLIGERTAEEIKFEIGSAWPLLEEVDVEVRGRDLLTGLPRTITMESEEIREAVEEPTSAIVAAVKGTLEQTPPELASDLMEYGIVLTGGGALLKGLDERLRHETGMPVHVSDSALDERVSTVRRRHSKRSMHSRRCSRAVARTGRRPVAMRLPQPEKSTAQPGLLVVLIVLALVLTTVWFREGDHGPSPPSARRRAGRCRARRRGRRVRHAAGPRRLFAGSRISACRAASSRRCARRTTSFANASPSSRRRVSRTERLKGLVRSSRPARRQGGRRAT